MEGGLMFVLFTFERRGVSETTLAVFMTFLYHTFSKHWDHRAAAWLREASALLPR